MLGGISKKNVKMFYIQNTKASKLLKLVKKRKMEVALEQGFHDQHQVNKKNIDASDK